MLYLIFCSAHTHTHTTTHERMSARARDRQLGINSNAIFVCFIYPTVYVFDFIFFNLRSEWIFIFFSFYTWTTLWIQLVQQPTRVHSRVATVEWFQSRTSIKNVFPCNVFVVFFLSFRAHSNEMKTQLKCKLIQKIDFLYSNVHFRWNGNVKHLIRVFSSSLLMLRKVFFIFNSENRCNNLRRKNPSNFNSFSIFRIFNKDCLGNALSLLYTDVCRQRFIHLSFANAAK